METFNTGNVAQNGKRQRVSLPELAAAMGSKDGTDPIPPSQYLTFLDKKFPVQQRLLAWVRSKTIRFRPQDDGSDGRSAFAVDDHGRPLGLADMARELKLKLPNASREWKKAETLGLVARSGKHLLLVGDVKPKGKAKIGRNVICTDNIPPSILKKIQGWPETRQKEFIELWNPAVELAPTVEAAYVAKGREVTSGMYRSILSRFGLVEGKAKPRAERRPVKIPPHLVNFVQITLFDDVQITTDRSCTDNEKLHVQDNPILMQQRTTREERQPSASVVDFALVADGLGIDADAAKKIFEDSRKQDPLITPAEVIELARIKLRQAGKRAENWVGLLITSVPKMVRGPALNQLRSAVLAKAAAELSDKREWTEWKTRMEADRTAGKLSVEEIALLDSLPEPATHQNGHQRESHLETVPR